MQRVYLDYAASAPLAPEAVDVIQEFASGELFPMGREESILVGNPSSLHAEGRKAQAALDKSHTTVAAVFGVHPTEVVFTSGATESNNILIRGVLAAWRRENPGKTPHVVMPAIEHPSWRQVAQREDAEVTLVPVSESGHVSTEAVLAAIRDNTALVGCMFVNNELGTVQPVGEIGKAIQADREGQWPVFHVDAVQAFPYLNTHIGHVRADSMTLSGHKYGALGGAGVLILKKHTPFVSVVRGGAQEWGHRAGTENVLGALILARVIEWCEAHQDKLRHHAEALQHTLELEVEKHIPQATVLGKDGPRAPHITYLWFPDLIDEHLVHKLDLAGFAVSSGSACSSGARLPSSTLMALGYSDSEAFGGVRVSYGRFTQVSEIKQFVAELKRQLA